MNGQPTGNIADLLNDLFGTNGRGINILSSGLGALADLGGAGITVPDEGPLVVALLAAIGLFTGGSNSKPDPLQPILDALQRDFAQLNADLNARWNEEDWRNLAQLVGDAETVILNLDGLVNAQPPLTERDRLDHIATCESPLVKLSDSTIHAPSPFFLALYDHQVYWPGDGYYQRQAPPAPPDNQVFSYLYVLPYYLKAVFILTAVGTAFFADFGKTKQHGQDAVIMTANFLTTVYDLILGGITQLFSGFPGKRVPEDPGTYFEYGAVEKFSGFSSIGDVVFGPRHTAGGAEFHKVQIRALGELKKVYAGVGLPGVWAAINSLNKLAGQNPLPRHEYARWSFRETFGQAVSARSDGLFHLSDMGRFLRHTYPPDTAQTGPFSWRNLLQIGK
jgi:hypothetical protein